jgi:hypothetical protein
MSTENVVLETIATQNAAAGTTIAMSQDTDYP